ncbi:hypothetical protein, partial [Reichenbachiella sp. MALMAid0571]|uniref:hypothetical protein n=1 Tax=Reichenbachiella sp. MALMAid0571 TaxID=3143939 RepID=UPI0032DE6AF1
NNIFCGNDIIYDINYPMLRSGEQRFLGNVYDKSALQNTMKINPTSDVPSPFEDSALQKRVAFDLGVKTEEVTVDGKKVEMDLNEWQKFWQVHSMHYDSDAQVMKNISATYLP